MSTGTFIKLEKDGYCYESEVMLVVGLQGATKQQRRENLVERLLCEARDASSEFLDVDIANVTVRNAIAPLTAARKRRNGTFQDGRLARRLSGKGKVVSDD
jgi:hypothetical protein